MNQSLMKEELFKFIEQHISLNDEERKAIEELNLFRSYKKGTILLNEGDLSDKSYFVLKGCIRSYCYIDGEEKTTEFYTESQGLSPICVISKKPSEYYVSCVEDCILSVSTPNVDSDMFQRFPKFESMCRVLSDEVLSSNQTSFAKFKNSSPEQRYLDLLENKPDLIQRVPQYQLASYLGIKPESLSRIRQRLSQK